MTLILDGKTVANAEKAKIQEKVTAAEKQNIPCGLAVVLVGDDPASKVYTNRLMKMSESLNIKAQTIELSSNSTQEELNRTIQKLNDDANISGIMVMMPLPKHLSADLVGQAISPDKDMDAINPLSAGYAALGKSQWAPCTPRAVMAILDYYNIQLAGKHAVIIGRSNVVGKPLFNLLLARDATVTICHSKTKNLAETVRQGDIVVSAVGRPGFITRDMIKPGAVVVDVGINQVGDKIVGDVDFEDVKEAASAITPVPGGVGSVSTTMVMNTLVRHIKA